MRPIDVTVDYSYGMNNEADRGSSQREFSTRGPEKILSIDSHCIEDPPWAPSQLLLLFIRIA